jgi:hypothetical protein
MNKFKPCPFCGGTRIRVWPTSYGADAHDIRCGDCGGTKFVVSNSMAQFYAEWNIRDGKIDNTIEFDPDNDNIEIEE